MSTAKLSFDINFMVLKTVFMCHLYFIEAIFSNHSELFNQNFRGLLNKSFRTLNFRVMERVCPALIICSLPYVQELGYG